MPSLFDRFGLPRSSERSDGSSSADHFHADAKTEVVTSSREGGAGIGPDGEPLADQLVAPGELTFEEDTAGGLGRHLGLFTTTFLM